MDKTLQLHYYFELSLPLDEDKFHELLNRNSGTTEYSGDNKYIDSTLASNGIYGRMQ